MVTLSPIPGKPGNSIGYAEPFVPERLTPFIEACSSQLSGSNLSRKHVLLLGTLQLKSLRSSAGRYTANIHRWGFIDSALFPCGLIQTYEYCYY